MKYLTLLVASLFILSCNKADDDNKKQECTQIEFNTNFSMILNDEVCFPDGSGFIVKTIKDEFCPCLAVCIWEGELRVMVETIETNGDKELFEFGSSSFGLNPKILPNARIETFSFTYDETGTLPDCENDYEVDNVKLTLKIVEE